MTNTASTYTDPIIPGRFHHSILVSNVSGDVPLASQMYPGQLAINTTDKIMYGGDGNGVFITAAQPAGANQQVQYNANGALGANLNFIYDFDHNTLGIGNTYSVGLDLLSGDDARLLFCANVFGDMSQNTSFKVWNNIVDFNTYSHISSNTSPNIDINSIRIAPALISNGSGRINEYYGLLAVPFNFGNNDVSLYVAGTFSPGTYGGGNITQFQGLHVHPTAGGGNVNTYYAMFIECTVQNYANIFPGSYTGNNLTVVNTMGAIYAATICLESSFVPLANTPNVTITTAYGIFLDNINLNGSIFGTTKFSNVYGIYIADHSVFNNSSAKFDASRGNTMVSGDLYAFYSAGGNNYFGGPINANTISIGNSTVNTNVNSSLIQTTGSLKFGTFVANTTATLTGYIAVTDASGATRKLMCFV